MKLPVRGPLVLAILLIVVGVAVLYCAGIDRAALANAIVSWTYTALTGLLVYFALAQVNVSRQASERALHESDWQQRKWATLQVCDRYDIDAEISRAVRYLRRYHPYGGASRLLPPDVVALPSKYRYPAPRGELLSRGKGARLTADQEYTMAATKLLNYFDSIAIGLNQQFYVDDICREHIGGIFVAWMMTLRSVHPTRFDAQMRENFERLPRLFHRWGGRYN